jgi:hypothetical protein
MLSARDIREFRGFLRQATDRQVQGIYDKEKGAGRDDYAELAVAEAERRGIFLERADDDNGSSHSTKKSRAQLDREIADALKDSRGGRSHAVVKSAVPGIAKWDMAAGGTSAARGKRSYSYRAVKGEYHIWPYTTKYGRHAGYALKYAATGGPPRSSHGGLWHDLGSHSSPAGAAKAAREHYARSFE